MKSALMMSAWLAALFVGAANAQDPLKVAPQAYKLEFENKWVLVTRVHYEPNEKIPEHFHTERASAYVYLKVSGTNQTRGQRCRAART